MTRRIITVEGVYEPASECNAVRLLVDRLWPRGVKRENLQYASHGIGFSTRCSTDSKQGPAIQPRAGPCRLSRRITLMS